MTKATTTYNKKVRTRLTHICFDVEPNTFLTAISFCRCWMK